MFCELVLDIFNGEIISVGVFRFWNGKNVGVGIGILYVVIFGVRLSFNLVKVEIDSWVVIWVWVSWGVLCEEVVIFYWGDKVKDISFKLRLNEFFIVGILYGFGLIGIGIILGIVNFLGEEVNLVVIGGGESESLVEWWGGDVDCVVVKVNEYVVIVVFLLE